MTKADYGDSKKDVIVTDKLSGAREQGQAQFESITDMVHDLHRFRDDTAGGMESSVEDAERCIQEDPLSIQVRSGWYSPCDSKAYTKPAEYEILLCTGGPACRIVGDLSEHGEPETARLEVQDWFTPWTEYRPLVSPENYDSESILLAYAREFYFGEG